VTDDLDRFPFSVFRVPAVSVITTFQQLDRSRLSLFDIRPRFLPSAKSFLAFRPRQTPYSLEGFEITTMKYLGLAIAAVFFTATNAAPAWDWGEPYPAPCGRSIPSGRCSTESTCTKRGGFYVQRDCEFYGVGDIGCCYGIPQ